MGSPFVSTSIDGSSTTSNDSTGGSTFVSTSAGGGSLTASQQLQLQYLSKHKSSGNFLSDIKNDTGSILGKTLNYLSRPVDAVQGALTAGAAAGDKWNLKTWSAMLHGAKEGIEGKNYQGQKGPDTFSDYIRAEYPHFAKQHKALTAVGGIVGEIGLDPLLPLNAGGTLVHGAGDLADAARAAQKIDAGLNITDRIANTKLALAALKDTGTGFDARRIYANLALEKNVAEQAHDIDYLVDTGKTQALSHARVAAGLESAAQGKRVLQLKYMIPFSHGKSIPLSPAYLGGVRVAPLVPTLARMAAGEGIFGKLPIVPKAADAIAAMFKHGYRDPEFAKPALEAKHFEKFYNEHLSAHYLNTVQRSFRHLSIEQMHDALHVGETHTGIVTGAERTYHDDVAAKSGLSDVQQGFLKAWHTHTEAARKLAVSHGVVFDKDLGDKVYVPHNFNTEGGILRKSAVRAAAGFTHARASDDTTLRDLDHSVNGKVTGLSIETHPHTLAAMMNANVANEAAKTTLLRHMRLAAGVASRIPDVERSEKALSDVKDLQGKQDDLHLLVNQKKWKRAAATVIRKKAEKRLKAAVDEHGARVEAIHAEVLSHAGQAAEQIGKGQIRDGELVGKDINTPSWSRVSTLGRDVLKSSIKHFTRTDQSKALALHSRIIENKQLVSRLARLGDPKGGPATYYKSLAEDVAKHITGGSKDDVGLAGEHFAPKVRGASWKGNLKLALNEERTRLQTQWKDITDKYPNARGVNHLALAAKAQARIATEEKRFLTKAARIERDVRYEKAKAADDFEKKFDTQARLHKSYDKQIESKMRVAATATMKNPAVPKEYVKWARKIDGAKYYFPKNIHEAMTRMETISSNDEALKALADGARNLFQKWKIGVTSANPGYAFRNHVSEIWNMTLDGIPIPRILQYNKRTVALMKTINRVGEVAISGGKLTAEEALAFNQMSEMAGQGILNGLFQGDIQDAGKAGAPSAEEAQKQATSMFNSKAKARDYLRAGKPGHAYIRLTQDFNRNRENMNRITSYLYHREHEGMSAYDAANRTKASLFDYQELTPTEQGKFKLIVPFWTWTRKNVPYQLQHILGRPGKFSNFAKIAETSNELASGTPFGQDQSEGSLPSWMKDGYGFRVPGFGSETYYQPNFGVNDLSKLEHPTTAISLVNPIAQVAYTAATGTDPFTKQPIVGSHPRDPIAGWAANVLKYLPGSDVGPTERSVRGKEVTGAGINPWYSYALSQLPITNVLTSSSNIKQAQRGGGLAQLSYLAGVPLYKRDIPSEQTGAALNEQTAEERWAKGLRDAGLAPPTKKKSTSAFQAQINSKIDGG